MNESVGLVAVIQCPHYLKELFGTIDSHFLIHSIYDSLICSRNPSTVRIPNLIHWLREKYGLHEQGRKLTCFCRLRHSLEINWKEVLSTEMKRQAGKLLVTGMFRFFSFAQLHTQAH